MFLGGLDPHQMGLVNESDLPGQSLQKPKCKTQKAFWERKQAEARLEME